MQNTQAKCQHSGGEVKTMAEVKKARIAFVGCGGHATHSLFPAVHRIPEMELVAVCDLREELAQRNARWFGAQHWYTDVATMLAKEELDGVVIVGPPQMHYEVGKQCLDAGLPIFVEKPSALSYALARDLAEHADRKGLWGAVAYMKRFAVGYELAKQIARREEEFGRVTHALGRRKGPAGRRSGMAQCPNGRGGLIGQQDVSSGNHAGLPADGAICGVVN
jgi:predicted dehydrogenase